MLEPALSEFGINADDMAWAKNVDRTLPRYLIVISAVFWTTYAVHSWMHAKSATITPLNLHAADAVALLSGLMLYLIAGSCILFFTTLSLYVPCLLTLPLIFRRYRQVEKFKRADAAFRAWWIRTQNEFWQSLSGIQFEVELAAVFRRAGIRAELTAASGDNGVDIWLYRDGGKEIVQCKAHGKPLGPAVARELYGTLEHFHANYAILASTSGFTKGVKTFVRDKPIKLMGLPEILQLQQRGAEHR